MAVFLVVGGGVVFNREQPQKEEKVKRKHRIPKKQPTNTNVNAIISSATMLLVFLPGRLFLDYNLMILRKP